jgi:hypothetical protein
MWTRYPKSIVILSNIDELAVFMNIVQGHDLLIQTNDRKKGFGRAFDTKVFNHLIPRFGETRENPTHSSGSGPGSVDSVGSVVSYV